MNDVVPADAGFPSRIERLIAALSTSTQRIYRNGWRKWKAFALEHRATLFPADPEALAAFVAHLAAAGAKPSTIQTDLAGVSAAHRLTGVTPNPATSPDVRAACQLANRAFREAGGTVRQSIGITDEVMARIEDAAYRPRPRGKGFEPLATAKERAELDIAMIRTMRDTLARVGEAAAFTWQQIERRPDGSATITFRRPKTDADTTAYLARATVAALDAVRRGAADNESVFGFSTSRIKRRIKDATKAAGLDGVSSHGCRVGMAQDLARTKGIEMAAIMQAGGWRSETTVARYTARENAARGAVARFYAQKDEE